MCEHHSFDPNALSRRGLVKAFGLGAVGITVAGATTALGTRPAYAATSVNGWPAAENLALNKEFNAPGEPFPPGVAPGAPSVILGYVAKQFNDNVEKLYNPGCWGFAYRPIRGGTALSNHSSGTAIDCNAPDHPQGKANTFSSAQVATITEIVNHLEGTVRWGGTFGGSSVDDMHFELNKPPSDPLINKVVEKLGGTPQPPARPVLKEGDRGAAVTEAQKLLTKKGHAVEADGIFGPKTKAAVIAFQKASGLEADGVIGPKTWAKLDA
ncbi:peptidoglycan-binding protein [Propionibacteriaceae bacterium Y1685]|uniref:peptidoglycan-binding protein n=1 Tax=Microlunatus sp. Y1700 TaxID=3418487 RepID=UPI003B82AEFC